VITQLSPIVTGLLAFLWLGEKLATFQIVAMAVCFGGITIVALSDDAAKESAGVTDGKSELTKYKFGVVFALLCVCISALTSVTTRGIRGLHFSVIQLYVSAFAFLFSAIWLLLYMLNHEVFQLNGGAMTWIKLLMGSFCLLTAQLCSTCTNQSMNPDTVGMFMYFQIFYSYTADVLVFDPRLNPLQFLGGGIIFTFTVAGAIHKRFTQSVNEETK